MHQTGVKLVAAFSLVVLVTMTINGLDELRGALAYARFDMARRMASGTESERRQECVLQRASEEAKVVMSCGSLKAQELWEISRACHRWSEEEDLQDSLLRLAWAEEAVRAAALAARAAPSDYTNWLQLARTLAALGLKCSAEKCRERARQLAPCHK